MIFVTLLNTAGHLFSLPSIFMPQQAAAYDRAQASLSLRGLMSTELQAGT
jgi:hypothetical protein